MVETTTILPELLPGFAGAVLVTRGGRPVLREAAGVADAATGQLLTPESIFQLCSVSKQFTAAAVLLLAEDGALDLHAPIATHLPEAPEAWAAITPHHLISNTSGLGHWEAVPEFDAMDPLGPQALVAELVKAPLRFEPGTGWYYSSPGFTLAGLIVQQVTGAPYREFLARRIFGPLGMTSTSAAVPVREAAQGHVGGKPSQSPRFAQLPGGGDVYSTIDDLARYAAAFDAGEILSERSRRLAVTAHAPMPAEETDTADDRLVDEGYGYGYVVGTLLGHRLRYHNGDNPGFRSLQVRLPELDVSMIALSNQDETSVEAVAFTLVERFPEVFAPEAFATGASAPNPPAAEGSS
jgi:CubicO group peptidase (beta-lactamase class C family)